MNLNCFIKCQETLENKSSKKKKKKCIQGIHDQKMCAVKFNFKFHMKCIGFKDPAV